MSDPAEFDARLTAVESHVGRLDGDVAAAVSDAAAARHLAAARDRDLADLTIKVDANRAAINALGVQSAEGFAGTRAAIDDVRTAVHDLRTEMNGLRLEMNVKFELVDRGFGEMRAKFDQTAAGMERIVELLTDRGDR